MSRETSNLKLGDILWELIHNPHLEVEFNDTLDIICLGDGSQYTACPNCLEASCKESLERDRRHLEEYGFRIGQVVTASEVLRAINEYGVGTGVISPVTKEVLAQARNI